MGLDQSRVTNYFASVFFSGWLRAWLWLVDFDNSHTITLVNYH